MRIHRNSIIVMIIISLISFISAWGLENYLNDEGSMDFWINVLLGVFTGGILGLITSILGYKVERRKAFEEFGEYTEDILIELKSYRKRWSKEKKILCLTKISEIRMLEWEKAFREFCFLVDIKSRKRKYIFEEIYLPLNEFFEKLSLNLEACNVGEEILDSREEMENRAIENIESLLLEPGRIELEIRGNMFCLVPHLDNKIIKEIENELNTRYFKLTYGRRAHKRRIKQQKELMKSLEYKEHIDIGNISMEDVENSLNLEDIKEVDN